MTVLRSLKLGTRNFGSRNFNNGFNIISKNQKYTAVFSQEMSWVFEFP